MQKASLSAQTKKFEDFYYINFLMKFIILIGNGPNFIEFIQTENFAQNAHLHIFGTFPVQSRHLTFGFFIRLGPFVVLRIVRLRFKSTVVSERNNGIMTARNRVACQSSMSLPCNQPVTSDTQVPVKGRGNKIHLGTKGQSN